jgi:exopolysaccharide production protein ExoY
MIMASTETTPTRPTFAGVGPNRILDVLLALITLFAIWPLLVLIGLAIALTSRGPVLFMQTRVGLGGKTFDIVKFRSMYRDAEKRRAEVEDLSDRQGLCLKLRADPRVTPIGRFLRRWSLDELPQLFNVIAGEMSLVGPRPALTEEVASYPEHAHRRHEVLPGITGLWQVSGRADMSFSDMIELDLEYVRRVSVLTDAVIMMRTVGAVFSGKGAY